jgi:starvation-inducible DNA-binding protein
VDQEVVVDRNLVTSRKHEMILLEARTMAKQADNDSDEGTNDLAVSGVIRTNELQVWFVSEHLVDSPLLHADGAAE